MRIKWVTLNYDTLAAMGAIGLYWWILSQCISVYWRVHYMPSRVRRYCHLGDVTWGSTSVESRCCERVFERRNPQFHTSTTEPPARPATNRSILVINLGHIEHVSFERWAKQVGGICTIVVLHTGYFCRGITCRWHLVFGAAHRVLLSWDCLSVAFSIWCCTQGTFVVGLLLSWDCLSVAFSIWCCTPGTFVVGLLVGGI